ncbi:MAG: 16S rRNA (cytosine(1402)-N(4))-methyltransferase RsmH, partial [Halanaerobiales bacterium]
MNKEHIPVLLEETIEYLNCQKEGIYIDGTLGRGGHTGEILKKLEGTGKLIGIDRDIEAIRKVEERYGKLANLDLIHDNYINIPAILDRIGIREVDGMLFDLGVSSPQFDNPERGFSYNYDAFLDMRMDQEQELTAAEIVNTYSQEDLSRIIKDYGEEKWASRIADFIVKARKRKPIERTLELVEIIKAAIPAAARRSGGHPAR